MISDYMLEVRGIISRSFNRIIFLLFIGLLIIAGLSVPALAQMSDITPNGIAYLSEADTLTAGKTYNITVQILYQGGQLKSEGVRVYFLTNNTSIIPAELGTYVLTDKNGIANYTVTSNKTGDVMLTAFAMNTNSGVSADKNFHVIEGPVATPTATPLPSPSPTPTPGPTANATVTAIPSLEPTPTAMPTIAPTITAAPTSPPPSGDSNAQAIGIITAGIVIAVIIIVLVLVARVFKKK
jgi:hypothetical protein